MCIIMYKYIILSLIFILASCKTIDINNLDESSNHKVFFQYDYSMIHQIWLNHPGYFYQNTYIDPYGAQRYMHMHPHYIRYCNDKKVRYQRTTTNQNNSRRYNQPTTFRSRTPEGVRNSSHRVNMTNRTYNTRRSTTTTRNTTTRQPTTTRSVNNTKRTTNVSQRTPNRSPVTRRTPSSTQNRQVSRRNHQ